MMPKSYDWVDCNKPIIKDKTRLIQSEIRYMLARTQRMFEYKGLPDTIPQREIEKILQTLAFVIWKRVDGELYVFYGGLGGVPNEYYLPTNAIISNPYLKYFATCKIDEDCVVMWNDSSHIGLLPMFEEKAELIAETKISLRYACVNSRVLQLLIADNDTTKTSMETFMEKVEKGEDLSVIATNPFFEGVKTKEYSNQSSTNIKDLIELQQYLRATWFNDLGINANYNMKRESINESESGMNTDALLPLVDDMLEQRKIALDKINEMFGTNISVELSSSWKKIRSDIVSAKKEGEESPIVNEEKEGESDETE